MSKKGSGGNVMARRLVIRFALIAALVSAAFLMHSIGKEHNVMLDNKAAVIGGIEYAPIEALSLSVDGVKKSDVKAGGRAAHKMIGKRHVITVGILRPDKTVEKTIERSVRLGLDMKKWMISLPALAVGASDIYIPSQAAPPPPLPHETETFDTDGEPAETLPGI
jgi:hypothetical protein